MAISKLILNGEVQMDVTSDTVEANKLLEGETATKNDGTKVTGTFVAPDPVISSLSVTPTESAQTFNEASISGYKPVTVGAIASDYVGSAIPMRSSEDVYFNGSQARVPSGYYSNNASQYISAVSATAWVSFESSTGTIRGGVSVYSPGYLDGGKQKTSHIPTLSAQTITPTESTQYISSYQWLTGSQTIAAIPSSYIIPSGTSAITSNGTFDIASYASANINVVPNLVSKSVTPTESEQVITAGSLYTRVDGSFKTGETKETNAKAFSQISSAASTLIADTYIISGTIDIYDENKTTLYQTLTINENDWEFSRISGSKTTILFSKSNTDNYIDDLAISYYSATGCALWYSKVWRTKLSLVVNLTFYTKDADGLSQVTVNAIPSSYIIPSGTYSVTENGTYDIGSYASVDVSVAGGGGDSLEDALIMRTLTSYENSRVSYVGRGAFAYASSMSVNFPNATLIQNYAFYSAKILSASFPNVTQIGASAFDSTVFSTAIYSMFPNVKSISSYAFRNARISYRVEFPEIEYIGDYGFYDCGINFGSWGFSMPKLISIGRYAFASNSNFGNQANGGDIIFPSLTTIGEGGFNSCYRLQYISIQNVISMGAAAFNDCSSLRRISLPIYSAVIPRDCFRYCGTLSDVNIPNTTGISSCAFQHCSSLQSAIFPEVSYISSSAFQYCHSLSTLSISKCKGIEAFAFESCSRLTEIILPECSKIFAYAFQNCRQLMTASLPQVSRIESYAFRSCYNLSTVFIPMCSYLGSYAFYACSSLTSIDIPQVQSLYPSVFCSTGLTSIIIPEQCSTFGSGIFYHCHELSLVTLYNSPSVIYDWTFTQCWNLLSLYLLGSNLISLTTTNVFNTTPISTYTASTGGIYGSIYVPASLYNDYLTATNWAVYSARIVSLTNEQIDPIIKRGAIVNAGRITATSVVDSTYATSSVSFSHALTPSSTYVLNDVLRYKDTSGSYHLITNSPGVSFIASVNEVFPHRSTGDVTYGVGCASDHAAFLWKRPSDITDISEVICDYTICEYNA